MKKFLSFAWIFAICIGIANAAVRDENATNRENNPASNNVAQNISSRTAASATPGISRTTTSRAASQTIVPRSNNRTTTSRATTSRSAATSATNATTARSGATISRSGTTQRTSSITRRPLTQPQTTSRAATTTATMSDTQIGAEYEQCKSAYFTCMDQFCQLKNDDYRRCSCSNRVFDLTDIRNTMQDASDKLTVFTENLDVVGMTSEQATAMKTASEGENALTADTSASKALLKAIMNSIRGDDTTVGGKFTDLNSINLSFDTTNAFGLSDAGQIISTYNGQNLYSAVYPQCREAVRADCTDAQLQRAINAYLMAIEQDCNTVESALVQQQSEMKAAVRESSAMLDLARVENRQNHNSDDMATCLANVESAILSEEVCGANYHKCLDNGQFIDVSTGAPIAGVENFYELGNLLKFADNVDAADQKLSKISSNRAFVQNFEKRVKKFAEPALDKCTEQADIVWSEYLDKAMLDIYYAQQSKVAEIKQGCFDFVSACYMNGDTALTAAMAELTGDDGVLLQPDKVTLSTEMCRDYIDSCNMMFYDQTGGENIVTDYINNRQDTDTLTACRAVVQQCFDSFGGNGYENFYYPYSGLFSAGKALDWFTLYKYNDAGVIDKTQPVSECARQLTEISSCNTPEIIEQAFGGFNIVPASVGVYGTDTSQISVIYLDTTSSETKYGTLQDSPTMINDGANEVYLLNHHVPRPTGVATEIYNQIVDILTTQCTNLQGRFIEYQFVKSAYNQSNFCLANFKGSEYDQSDSRIIDLYGIGTNEDMCPRNYGLNVDTQSWGACLCWENGGRRSKWGTSPKCVAASPAGQKINATTIEFVEANDAECNNVKDAYGNLIDVVVKQATSTMKKSNWCTQTPTLNTNLVCPIASTQNEKNQCVDETGNVIKYIPDGLQ